MFVYSVKASFLRFIAVLAVCIAAMALFLALIPSYNAEEPANASSGDNALDMYNLLEYVESLGWSVSDQPEKAEYVIPADFDSEARAYNEIQKQHGFDLSEYAGETAVKYTYELTNYKEYDGTVYLNLITVDGKVVGGDISSAEDGGFITGIGGQ
ncbi:MAG: DUF4830 domain-containing protein [Clostridia bacterium]|nr:DUF4830 domain-containing protein [Clostridia bacterium]